MPIAMRSVSLFVLFGLLIVGLFAWNACQRREGPAARHSRSLSDSLERGYQRLQARYRRMGDSLPPDVSEMVGSMQQMHRQMRRGGARGGRGMRRGPGDRGMQGEGRRQHHRHMHGGAQREWHQQMQAVHRQMAQMHREQHPGMAAQHRTMARWHQQMFGAVSADTAASSTSADRSVASGEVVYQQQCASCHGAEGQGLAGSFPPLAKTTWVMGETERLVRILLHGLQGPVEVRGTRYNGVMPAFGQRLSDAEIAAVLTYVRSSWSNQASDVMPGTVRNVRVEHSERASPWSASEFE